MPYSQFSSLGQKSGSHFWSLSTPSITISPLWKDSLPRSPLPKQGTRYTLACACPVEVTPKHEMLVSISITSQTWDHIGFHKLIISFSKKFWDCWFSLNSESSLSSYFLLRKGPHYIQSKRDSPWKKPTWCTKEAQTWEVTSKAILKLLGDWLGGATIFLLLSKIFKNCPLQLPAVCKCVSQWKLWPQGLSSEVKLLLTMSKPKLSAPSAEFLLLPISGLTFPSPPTPALWHADWLTSHHPFHFPFFFLWSSIRKPPS